MKTTLPTAEKSAGDRVIAEVYRAKAKLLEQFGYDLSAMIRDARVRQNRSGRSVKK